MTVHSRYNQHEESAEAQDYGRHPEVVSRVFSSVQLHKTNDGEQSHSNETHHCCPKRNFVPDHSSSPRSGFGCTGGLVLFGSLMLANTKATNTMTTTKTRLVISPPQFWFSPHLIAMQSRETATTPQMTNIATLRPSFMVFSKELVTTVPPQHGFQNFSGILRTDYNT